MNVQNVAINGKKRGGPRTFHKNNSNPAIKFALRRWLINYFNDPTILDVYGGYGLMFFEIYKKYANKYESVKGEAIEWLKCRKELNFDIFDIDPYPSPFEALEIINQKSIKTKIGIVCTDGCIRRQSQFRGNLPKIIQKYCEWPRKDNNLMAGIYYQYPKFLRYILRKIMSSYQIDKLVVKYGKGKHSETVYFAAILNKK